MAVTEIKDHAKIFPNAPRTFNHMTFGKLRNWCDYESLLYHLIG